MEGRFRTLGSKVLRQGLQIFQCRTESTFRCSKTADRAQHRHGAGRLRQDAGCPSFNPSLFSLPPTTISFILSHLLHNFPFFPQPIQQPSPSPSRLSIMAPTAAAGSDAVARLRQEALGGKTGFSALVANAHVFGLAYVPRPSACSPSHRISFLPHPPPLPSRVREMSASSDP
jgi:hypothetical protein